MMTTQRASRSTRLAHAACNADCVKHAIEREASKFGLLPLEACQCLCVFDTICVGACRLGKGVGGEPCAVLIVRAAMDDCAAAATDCMCRLFTCGEMVELFRL